MSARRCAVSLGVVVFLAQPNVPAQNEFLYSGASIEGGWGSVTTGDLDLDGRPDLITVRVDVPVGRAFVVRMGRPGRSFGAPQTHLVTGDVLFEQVLDVTGDGWPDVVFLNGAQVCVAPGLGGGQLGATIYSSTNEPWSAGGMDVADIDGDLIPDVAVAHMYSDCDCISILRGVGDGTFVPSTSAVIANTHGLRDTFLADFNADGLIDILALIEPPNQTVDWAVAVCLQLPGGGFGSAVQTVLPTEIITPEVGIHDFDGDGRPDLHIGTWWKPPKAAAAVLLRNVDGSSFEVTNPILLEGGSIANVSYDFTPVSVDVHDFDEDGVQDLLVAVQRKLEPTFGALYVLKGLGGFDFGPPDLHDVGGMPIDVAAADLDLDGHLDVAYAGYIAAHFTAVLHGNGDGTFEGGEQLSVGTQVADLVSGDLNGDRHADLVLALAGPSPSLAAQLGHGDGTFGPLAPVGQPAEAARIVLVDATSDGILDILAATIGSSPGVALFAGLGDGSFEDAESVSGIAATDIELADVNQDGLDDLVTCSPGLEAVVVQLGTGPGQYAAPALYPSGGASRNVALGDLDGDGVLDAVVANPPIDLVELLPESLATLRGLGGGVFDQPVLQEVYGAQDVATIDLDHDGKLDVVLSVHTQSTYGIRFRRGLGNGGFAAMKYLSWTTVAGRFEFADLNRDGLIDIVSAAPPEDQYLAEFAHLAHDGRIGIVMGVGGGAFTEAGIQARSRPVAATIADLDEDGFADLVVAQADTDTLGVFMNRSGTWADLGYAQAPEAGGPAPVLSGRGVPASDQPVSLLADGPGAASAGMLIAGFGAAFTPFQGGVLAPSIDVSGIIEGGAPLRFRWPVGIAAGTPVYLQALFAPGGGEVVATNALVVIAQ